MRREGGREEGKGEGGRTRENRTCRGREGGEKEEERQRIEDVEEGRGGREGGGKEEEQERIEDVEGRGGREGGRGD